MENIENDYSMPFSKCLNQKRSKYLIVITKLQYATFFGGTIHEYMYTDLVRKIRPDIEIDEWGNPANPSEGFNNEYIVINGYPDALFVELPKEDMLSPEQFEKLKGILLELKEYIKAAKSNANYELYVNDGSKIKLVEYCYTGNDIDALIEKISTYVQEPSMVHEEVIIGTPIRGKMII